MGQILDIKVADRLEGVGEYYFSVKLKEIDKLRSEGKEIISLGIGSPDTPPHPSVIEALNRESLNPANHAYQPTMGTKVLREAFGRWYSKRYGVSLDPASEILPLIGSKEGIMHICMTYLDKGDKVLIPNPGYPTYRAAVSIAGGVCVDYKLREGNDWKPDLAALEKAGLDGVKIMIVNYPQMPTGSTPTRGLFEDLVAFARRHGILLVHDNPYSFIRNAEPMSLLSVEGAKDVAIELNSLSKAHSMAGWRIGMIGGAAKRISEIMRFKSNMDSGMFYPMQAAAAVALDLGDEWYTSLNEMYRRREVKAKEIMDMIGCTCAPGQAGLFLWGRLPEGSGDCYQFTDKILYDCGVFITPGGIFGDEGNNYVRISLCADEPALEKAKNKIKAGLKL